MIIIILCIDGISDENGLVLNDENERSDLSKESYLHSGRIESTDEEESSAKSNPSSIANSLATIVLLMQSSF